MNIISIWKAAPIPVKWTSLLWFVLGVSTIVSALFSLITSLIMPNSDMLKIFVIGIMLQMGMSCLIVVASWGLLLHSSWSRVVLEITTWLSLFYYAGFGIIWVGFALLNWNEFKTEMAAEVPQISPELKLIVGILIAVVLVIISAVVIRALRAPATRQYVGSKAHRA
jgi:hypothetical protein